MTEQMIIKTVEEYRFWEAKMAEVKKEMEALKKQLTDEMESRNADTMEAGQYVVRNTEVMSSRFDTKAFKEDFGADAYAEYTKEVMSHRFTIAG